MSDRKAELERKKAKLASLREEKERRRKERELKEAEEAVRSVKGGVVEGDVHQEVDKVLLDIGIVPVSDVVEKIKTMPSYLPESSGFGASDKTLGHSSAPRKKVNLTVANVFSENITPKEQVNYDKETQTAGTTGPTSSHGLDYYVLTYDAMGGDGEGEDDSFGPHYDTPPASYKKLLPPGVLHPGMPDVRAVKPALTVQETISEGAEGDGEGKKKVKELSDEEKKMIILSEEFQKFFDKSARYVERALAEDTDIFVDYTGILERDSDADDHSGMTLSLNRWFSDDRWSKGRVITAMDWSAQFPELLVASYSSRGGAMDIGGSSMSGNDPDGVALVWNTRYKRTTPEYIFHCQSPVMSIAFAKFHPNLIIGGTYSGRIVLWDNRVNKRTPVQRSTLSADAHTHPVYCLSVVGTQHAHNLVSVSTDGRLCGWGSLDMLAQPPQEKLELHQSQRQGKPVAATALAFPKSSPAVWGGQAAGGQPVSVDPGLTNDNYFLVGSEEGTLYSGCRHGSKVGIMEAFDGHHGPITSLDPHPGNGTLLGSSTSHDLSHLFLTSSFDWTVRLWSTKEKRPLYSFEGSNDYVYGVAWSPIHPAVFAAVDGSGHLDVWNLNYDTEVPAASVLVDNGAAALNCVSWTQSGQHVVVGDQLGKLWVYDLGDQLAMARPDEWAHMALTVQELRNSRSEEDYVAPASSIPMTGYSQSPSSSLASSASPHQSMMTPVRQSGPSSMGSPLSLR